MKGGQVTRTCIGGMSAPQGVDVEFDGIAMVD
jgi:hypothetical protein